MNGFPEKALVLAAGLGTRLRPLTLARPKPLLPLWGVPLLGRVLEMLEAWGVREVAVNLHWRPEMIREYLAERASGTRVRFSHEPEILGTGGALRPLGSFLEGGPFWVVNSDIAAALDPAPLFGRNVSTTISGLSNGANVTNQPLFSRSMSLMGTVPDLPPI